MKAHPLNRHLLATAAILLVGAAPAWYQHKRLGDLRTEFRGLEQQASELGLTNDADSGQRPTKRQRGDLEKDADRLSSSLISFARELGERDEAGMETDDEFQSRATSLMLELGELDASRIKRVIADLRAAPDLTDKSRSDILAFAVMICAEDHPATAVALFTESADLLGKNQLRGHVIITALGRWAETDPDTALAWLRQNASLHPDFVDEDAKRGLISGIAKNDPGRAFGLLDSMGFEDSSAAIHAIMATESGDAAKKTVVLEALRSYLTSIEDETKREETGGEALELLARTNDRDGFDTLTQWMSDARFTPQEKQQFSSGLTYFTTKQETGRWVEWLAGNVDAEHLAEPVRDLVSEWTQQDYQSAGKWLGTFPDGPARIAAVEAYAEAVSEYDPQVAAQWVLTLPPGASRDSSLRTIHENWPTSDPDGADAFASEHGLNHGSPDE
jgi:hypothetical protein